MICSDLNHWDEEKLSVHPVLAAGIEYLRSHDFTQVEPGRYDLRGDDMFALVQEPETAPKLSRMAEFHEKYIDIHYLVSGEEIIGYGRRSPHDVKDEDELETKDYALQKNIENENELGLKPGMFAVFFPNDVHRPCCSTGEDNVKICKVVIKVNKELLC
ncbi:Toxin-antitoxin biofilm protein TabA [compost metagenome]